MGSPHISFIVSLSFHKHLNGTQLNGTPTSQDSVKLAFTWRRVWEFKFLGACSHRTNPSSLWAQESLCALCSSAFSLVSQQIHSHLRSVNSIIDSPEDVWGMEDRSHQPAHTCCYLAHSTHPCVHQLTACPFLGCLGAPSPPHFYVFVPANQFSLSPHCWNLLNLWLLILFLGHHLRLGFWPSHVDYWNSSVN